MKIKEFICLIIAFAGSIATFIKILLELVADIRGLDFAINVNHAETEIVNSYIPPVVSSAVFCFLALLIAILILIFLISRRKQIVVMFQKAPEEKAKRIEELETKRELKRQQKIEELQKQLDELKKDE